MPHQWKLAPKVANPSPFGRAPGVPPVWPMFGSMTNRFPTAARMRISEQPLPGWSPTLNNIPRLTYGNVTPQPKRFLSHPRPWEMNATQDRRVIGNRPYRPAETGLGRFVMR